MSDDSTEIYVEVFRVDEFVTVLPRPLERQTHLPAEAKSAGVVQVLIWERDCLALSKSVYNTGYEVP